MRAKFFVLETIALVILLGCSTTTKQTKPKQKPKEETSNQASKQEKTKPEELNPSQATAKPNQQELDKFKKKIQKEKVRQQLETLLVKDYLKIAGKKANEGQYEAAYQYTLEALKLQPSHPRALQLKRLYGSKLGYRPEEMQSRLDEVVRRDKVKIEQARLEIDNRITKGKRLFDAKQYREAITLFKQAKNILRLMPYHVRDIKGKARQVDSYIRRAEEAYVKQQEQIKQQRMAEAEAQAKREEKIRLRTLKQKVRNLLRQANLNFEREKYYLAESFCREVERIDPDNKNVVEMFELIRQTRHAKAIEKNRDAYLREWRRVFTKIDEKLVPNTEILRWPSYEKWKKVRARSGKESKEEQARDTEAVHNLKRKLDENINLIFNESPLSEVVNYIRHKKQINIIIDPSVYKEVDDAEKLKVTIDVKQLKLKSLLNIILDMKKLSYQIDDTGVLIISTKKRTQETPVLRLYNVKDLTGKLKDFPGKDLTLGASKKGTMGAEQAESEESAATTITEEQLTDLIKDNIAKSSWDKEGRSIDVRHGALIVRQVKGVHQQIKYLLQNLRKATGLLVVIETRFITVADDFLEDIGVDWRSLGAVPSGGTTGDRAETFTSTEGTTTVTALNANDKGTGATAYQLDDAIFGNPTTTSNSIGTGKAAGAYWRYRDDLETRQRVENIFDETLGATDVLTNNGGLTFQMAYVDDIELQAILKAVRKRSRSNLLTAPRLTVFNTQRANISILTQVAYVQDYEVEIATNATIADPVVGTVQDGVVLDVRPIISSNRKYITLELQPTVAELQELEELQTQLASSSNSGAGTVTIELPRIQMTKIKTTVTVPDGGTVLLGGLTQATKEDMTSGVPVLSDLPIINFLFSRKGKYSHRQSLLILVTAKIVAMEETEPREGLQK